MLKGWASEQEKKTVVRTLVTLVLGILCGQGHEADRARSNPNSVTYCMTRESGAQNFSVSTTWRLHNFSSTDIGTWQTLKKQSYYCHYHHHRRPPPLLHPKVKRNLYHELNSQVPLECSFLLWNALFSKYSMVITQVLAPIQPKVDLIFLPLSHHFFIPQLS